MNYHLDWAAIFSGLPREWLVSGLITTIELTALASILATLLAMLLLSMRLSASRFLQRCAAVYTTVFRNTPLAVQLLFWYFGLVPQFPENWKDWLNSTHAWGSLVFPSLELSVGIWGLGLFSAAFVAEELRAGVKAVAVGQFEAATSQGFGTAQTLRFIILPQALANAWQPLIGQYLNLMKNSTLTMSIAVAELCYQINQVESYNLHAIEAFAVGSLLYLMLGLCISIGLERLGFVIFRYKRTLHHG